MSYSIQEVAKKMHITSYSIRYYHDQGMLPFVQRDANNNRVFNEIDLEWLQIIVCLRATGMPIAEIQHYLRLVQAGVETVPERYQLMKTQQARTQAEIRELQQHLQLIDRKVAHYAEILADPQPDSIVPANLAAAQAQMAHQVSGDRSPK
ncbi:MerR family transcriptional regulator [Lapidilactobacillus salsurivasis]